MPELELQGPTEESDDEAEESDNEEYEDDTPPPRSSARIAGSLLRPGRYAMASTKVAKMKEKSAERKQAIEVTEQEEIKQIFVHLRVLEPVFKHNMAGVKPYSLIFCREILGRWPT